MQLRIYELVNSTWSEIICSRFATFTVKDEKLTISMGTKAEEGNSLYNNCKLLQSLEIITIFGNYYNL